MIPAAGALVVLGAALFGVAVVSGALAPLYGSIATSLLALGGVTIAGVRHHRRSHHAR